MSPRELHLRMAGVHHARLMEILYPGDNCEAVAVALAGRQRGHNRDVLTIHKLFPVPEEAYAERGTARVTWSTDFLPDVLIEAERRGQSIVKFHSHPGGCTSFSDLDDQADRDLFRSAYGWCDGVPIHASAIVLPDGVVVARGVVDDGTFLPCRRVTVVGNHWRVFQADESVPHPPNDGSRLRMALGDETTWLLRSLRIGVVGCSGTGSFVVEQLLRLGVGEIVVVDPDIVEDVNLNRILNSTTADADQGVPKVQVAARAASAIGLGGTVTPICRDLANREAVVALASCDALFGCVDSHDGRRLLNRIATFYLLPYIDVGVRIDAERGRIAHISGAVHYLQPGLSSLVSRGVVDPHRADAEALRRRHPDVYEDRLGEGYVRGAANVTRPAVISINGMFASMGVTEMLARLHGFREDDAVLAEQRLCLTDGYYSPFPETAPCSTLERHVGRGDVAPLLDMPDLEVP